MTYKQNWQLTINNPTYVRWENNHSHELYGSVAVVVKKGITASGTKKWFAEVETDTSFAFQIANISVDEPRAREIIIKKAISYMNSHSLKNRDIKGRDLSPNKSVSVSASRRARSYRRRKPRRKK